MGYNFDPELAPLLDFLPDSSLGLSDPVAARAAFLELIAQANADVDATGVVIENRDIPGPPGAPDVPVRIYIPEGLARVVPGILHIHGGGFVIGNLDSETRLLHRAVQERSRRRGCIRGLPAGAGDALPRSAGRLLRRTRVDSAKTAANSASIDPASPGTFRPECRGAASPPLRHCWPGTGAARPCASSTWASRNWTTGCRHRACDSCRHPDVEPAQCRTELGLLPRRPVPARCADDVPYHAAPARAEDLSGLPPAYVSTMEFDPLRDEGVQYALKLMQAGVATELHSLPRHLSRLRPVYPYAGQPSRGGGDVRGTAARPEN